MMAPSLLLKRRGLGLARRTCAKLRPEMLEQLLAPKKSETEILVVHPTPASSTAPTARA
eukprot:COSAG01_NODE_31769_length_591_cov_14.101626_1_plen_59_part_00